MHATSDSADATDTPRQEALPHRNTIGGLGVGVWVSGFFALMALSMIFLSRHGRYFPDDAYIFFRYARNIADGRGWAFNPTDGASNGATSPLWTAVLALAYRIHGDMETNASVLYSMSLAGAGLLTFASLRRAGQPAAGVLAAIFLVVNPVLVLVNGMESALFLCLAAGFAYVALSDARDAATGVLGGLLILARPEGAALVAIAFTLRWWQTRRIPWKVAICTGLVLAPWVIFATATFGSPIAGTLAAKTAQGASGFWGPRFLFIRYLGTMVHTPWSLIMMFLAAPGILWTLRTNSLHKFVGLLAIFGAVHFAIYGLIVRPPAYVWYYSTTYWVLAVLAALGIEAIARAALGMSSANPESPSGGLRIALILLLGVSVLALNVAKPMRHIEYTGYDAASVWLVANGDPGQTIAATEIGVLGWETNRPIVDYLGLLDAQSSEELAVGDLRSWLDRKQPDFYVQHVPVWNMESPSMSLPWFSKAYVPVFETTDGGWSRVRVFERTRTREQAMSSNELVLVSPALEHELRESGVTMTPDTKNALGTLLAIFLADSDLQRRFETSGGVNISALIQWTADAEIELLTPYSDNLRMVGAQLPIDWVRPLA